MGFGLLDCFGLLGLDGQINPFLVKMPAHPYVSLARSGVQLLASLTHEAM